MHRIGSSNLICELLFFFFGGVIKMRSVTRMRKCESVGVLNLKLQLFNFLFSSIISRNRLAMSLVETAVCQK